MKKSNHFDLSQDQLKSLNDWDLLSLKKDQLSKKKREAEIKLNKIKSEIEIISQKKLKLKPKLKRLKNNYIPIISIGFDKRWSTYNCIIKIGSHHKSFYLGKEKAIKDKINVFFKEDISNKNIAFLKEETIKIIRNVINNFLPQISSTKIKKHNNKLSFENIIKKYEEEGDWEYYKWTKSN